MCSDNNCMLEQGVAFVQEAPAIANSSSSAAVASDNFAASNEFNPAVAAGDTKQKSFAVAAKEPAAAAGKNERKGSGKNGEVVRVKNKKTLAAVSQDEKLLALNAMEELRARGATTEDLKCRLCNPVSLLNTISRIFSFWVFFHQLFLCFSPGPSPPTRPS